MIPLGTNRAMSESWSVAQTKHLSSQHQCSPLVSSNRVALSWFAGEMETGETRKASPLKLGCADSCPTRGVINRPANSALCGFHPKNIIADHMKQLARPLSEGELHELKRWNTPTIYNGWEQITRHDAARRAFNLEPVCDYMPQMGPMAGYAITVTCQPGNPRHKQKNPRAWSEYRRYVASLPGPKIVVVQDLDKPALFGSFWGEVTSNLHRALGCVGTIVDGGVRDTDEMTAAGFKALARGSCVGHAHSCPIRWGIEVEVFGRKIKPGQLIHADKHGFLAVPFGDEPRLLEAAKFMDANECKTLIAAARDTLGATPAEICDALDRAGAEFRKAAAKQFARQGEW